jgi:hypothetical protein
VEANETSSRVIGSATPHAGATFDYTFNRRQDRLCRRRVAPLEPHHRRAQVCHREHRWAFIAVVDDHLLGDLPRAPGEDFT